jgi:hypothetical protein
MSSECPKQKYGIGFSADADDLEIEFAMIKKGEAWLAKRGRNLFDHYRKAQDLMWPEEDNHRWSDLILKEILQNDITVLMGPKDSSKTHGMTKFGLTDYFCFPNNTLIIVSSTDLRSLEGRVWGDMKGMWRRAKQRWLWLPGSVLDSKHAICTDDLDDESVLVRDMRRGILCVPTRNSSGGITNISAYVGMKQERKRYLADEFQFMTQAMYDSLANANSGNFKMVCAGNPLGQGDPLDLISEPKGGWISQSEPDKTLVWDNERFLRSRTVNLVGTDSPNFDPPDTLIPKYPYLINRDSIARTVAGYGQDSHQYYSQCKGVRKSGLNARRVITRELCRQFKAFDPCLWHGSDLTKIFALDAAYGGVGGDRCVGGHLEYGVCDDGKIRISVQPPQLVPVSIKKPESPEEQIAAWCRDYCEANSIPPENGFYDATGRGSLGIAFARLWSAKVNPVEFGGNPTPRPVSREFYITDDREGSRRLKRCDEHYRKFVTELWWTTRLLIESDQCRNLPEDVCAEGCMREWKEVAGNRIEVETKTEMKERMGRSPDLYDWFVTACEGARRKGFQITKVGAAAAATRDNDWLAKESEEYGRFIKSRRLQLA